MDVAVCLERAGPCEVLLHVLQDAKLPKPICNWNTDFKVKGNTLNKNALHTECVGTRLCIRSSLLCEPVSLRVEIATSSDGVSSRNMQGKCT
jgi:hypothetical protein